MTEKLIYSTELLGYILRFFNEDTSTLETIEHSSNLTRISIWLVAVLFLLFQFFLQLSSGIVIGAIMHDMALSASNAGLLSSAFYYIYTSMQIPVGMLFDRYNTRQLLTFNAALCALGCFVFANSYSFFMLFLGRLIIGGGSSFAFIGMSHILRQHFPLKHYAFMVGLSETLGFVLTVTGMIGMGSFIDSCGWRFFIHGAGYLGLFIAALCWIRIPTSKPLPHSTRESYLKSIFKNKLAWFNGLFVGLEFSVITVFAALWSLPFIQQKLHCNVQVASTLSSLILLGAGLSCPLYGKLAYWFTRRKPLIHFSCLFSAFLMLLILFAPIQSTISLGFLMFILGLTCGAYMLAYSISNELAPPQALSTCTGFTNTLAMASAPLMQPLVGLLLDHLSTTPGHYSLQDYQHALLILPIALVLASILSQFLPEKHS